MKTPCGSSCLLKVSTSSVEVPSEPVDVTVVTIAPGGSGVFGDGPWMIIAVTVWPLALVVTVGT